MNPQSDCTTPTKKQTKALRQAQRRANPVTRRLEQSSDTVRRRSARTNQAVQEHEQFANTVRRGIARDEPGAFIFAFIIHICMVSLIQNHKKILSETILRLQKPL